ncbi:hypothetical protein BDZ89DRAFT_1045564 [Hymenopellis radicata]|nr:hypothetical protein BDZ89DRAFT_1045564 [Hymenopellis radicata]
MPRLHPPAIARGAAAVHDADGLGEGDVSIKSTIDGVCQHRQKRRRKQKDTYQPATSPADDAAAQNPPPPLFKRAVERGGWRHEVSAALLQGLKRPALAVSVETTQSRLLAHRCADAESSTGAEITDLQSSDASIVADIKSSDGWWWWREGRECQTARSDAYASFSDLGPRRRIARNPHARCFSTVKNQNKIVRHTLGTRVPSAGASGCTLKHPTLVPTSTAVFVTAAEDYNDSGTQQRRFATLGEDDEGREVIIWKLGWVALQMRTAKNIDLGMSPYI